MTQPQTFNADATQAGDLVVREYEPQDAEGVIAVSRAAFRRWPLPPGDLDPRAYLEWFASAPASLNRRMSIALIDGRVAGAACCLRHPTKALHEVTVSSVNSIGFATDPSLQRRGVYKALRDAGDAKDPHRFVLGLSTGWSSRTVAKGIPLANELSLFLRVLRPRQAAGDRRGRAILNSLGYAWLQLRGRLRARRAPRDVSWTVRDVEAFDDRVEPFVEEAATAWDYIVLPTVDYLNWRYLDPRAGKFHALAAEQDGKLLGYLVYSNRWGRGDIADVLALPGRTDVVRSLVDAAIANLDAEGASAVECRLLSNHPYAGAVRRAGFVRLGKRSKKLTQQLSLSSWGIDLDRFQALGGKDAAIHVVHGYFDEA